MVAYPDYAEEPFIFEFMHTGWTQQNNGHDNKCVANERVVYLYMHVGL